MLVPKVRDKGTTITIIDAGLLPGRPDSSDGFVYRGCALEMGRIGRKLVRESLQTLNLFWSGYGSVLVQCPDVLIVKTGYVPSTKWPTSTTPGLILTKSTPSFLYCALNLATMTFMAALEAEYNADVSISRSLIKSRSPCPLEMAITFFRFPLKTRGRKRLKRWMLPMTLVWNSFPETASNSSTWSALLIRMRQP